MSGNPAATPARRIPLDRQAIDESGFSSGRPVGEGQHSITNPAVRKSKHLGGSRKGKSSPCALA
jgi:hypothetical protein